MGLVSQTIDNLLNGVSQQPERLRHPSQGEVQENALDTPAGKSKRPPTVHVAKLDPSPTAYDGAHIHIVHRDQDEKYRVVVTAGAIRVFDALTGQEYSVTYQAGSSGYLNATQDGYRSLTVGDTTLIVNRDRPVKNLARVSRPPRNEALFFIRQADFSTTYTVTLDGASVVHTTVDATNAQARSKISTDYVAIQLYDALVASPATRGFVFTRYGSTVHIMRTDDREFSLSVSDGLGDKGIRVVKGSVQAFEDLPSRAPNGFVIQIAGDRAVKTDDYYMVYDGSGSAGESGVWRETVRPATLTHMDPSTLPHALVRNGRLLEGEECGGTPPPPIVSVSREGVLKTGYGETETGSPVSETADDAVTSHGTGRQRPVPAGLTSSDSTYSTFFSLDTSVMEPGSTADVVLNKVAGGVRTELGRRRFVAGRLWGEEALTTNAPLTTSDKVLVTLEYQGGATPANPSRRALMTIPGRRLSTGTFEQAVEVEPGIENSGGGSTGSPGTQVDQQEGGGGGQPATPPDWKKWYPKIAGRPPMVDPWVYTEPFTVAPPEGPQQPRRRPPPERAGVEVRIVTGRKVNFRNAYSYPTGSTVTLVLGGTSYPHTVTNPSGESPEQVCSYFSTAIPSTASYTVSVRYAGELTVESTSPSTEAPSLTASVTFPATVAWIPAASRTAGEFVGAKLLNLSDGSEGTITANGVNTITVGSLIGGARNAFRRGDKIAVVPAALTFTFGPAAWRGREVGDLDTVPWPSFLNRELKELFFYQNRLGFVAGENIVMSAAGDLFNFFRQTATDLLADDYIDLQSADREVANFHTALAWNEGMYFFSDKGQFLLSGDPALTPTTVRLDHVSSFENARSVRPLPMGGSLFMVRRRATSTQVLQYAHPPDSAPVALDVTQMCPTYLRGEPADIAGDATLGFLAVTTRGTPSNRIYVYRYEQGQGGSPGQSSWGLWVLPVGLSVINMEMYDGRLDLILKGSDGVFLETLDLDTALDMED